MILPVKHLPPYGEGFPLVTVPLHGSSALGQPPLALVIRRSDETDAIRPGYLGQ
jgi:hypothetical protein